VTTSPTASLLIIGSEILSGRTQDKNISYLANFLSDLGIDLTEVRIVPDEEGAIVDAVNALRKKTTYLFTTGGIGPTHDDITADCVAKAFGVPIDHDPRAVAILRSHYKPEQLNEARLRMARMPHGAELIDNPVSKAPGFVIENVYVMAGVPAIMQAMLDTLAPKLAGAGKAPIVVSIDTKPVREGDYAGALGELAEAYPTISVGSYPRFTQAGVESSIVLRGRDEEAITKAAQAVSAMLAGLKP
jgi:molybdenum cofactor synthesis domain-containing protein